MHRSSRLALAAILVVVAALALAPAASARGCGDRKTRWGYTNQLKAFGASCRTARSVSGSFNACRHRTFRRSACRRAVRWRCGEAKRRTSPTLIIARVTCRRGRGRVTFLNLSRD